MSTGPLDAAGGAMGAPYAQRGGPDADRGVHETGDQQRRTEADKKAESAAGIGETDGEDQFTSDRDADGRPARSSRHQDGKP